MRERRETLAGGAEILLRPIRPDDRERLVEGMRRLSPESRYRRFLTPAERLSAAALRYLTEVDHHDHEALVAIDPESDDGLGVARFVRSREDPEVAEVAVAVVDSWHGRGVGTALLSRLVERAREEGVRRFSAEILAENRPMLELLDDFGEIDVKRRERGSVSVEVELPPQGIGAALRQSLSAAARELVRVAQPRRAR